MKIRVEDDFFVKEHSITDEQFEDGFRDKWEIIVQLSKFLSFLPEVKEYRYSGSMLIYKFDKFDYIKLQDYLKQFIQELYSHAVVPELGDLVILRDTLMYDWPNQIQNVLHSVDHSSFNHSFFHGTVVKEDGDMMFLNLHEIEIFPLNLKIKDSKYPPLRKIFDSLLDDEDRKQLARRYALFLKPLEMQKEIDILEVELHRRQQYVDKKNRQLKNTLNKDRVKQAIGEDLYYLHFGEEDD